MGKLLTGRDKILLGLAFLGDVWDETRLVGGWVGHAYKTVYGFVPLKYRKQRFSESVYRMIKTGCIEKVIKNDQPCLRLHSSGKKRLTRDFPILKLQRKKWNGFWTIVIFDIAEISSHQRKSLRGKLLELGFSMYQRSVYISPFNWIEDLREFVAHRDLREVRIFRAKEVLVGNAKEQAAKIWQLDKLEEEYREILERIEEASHIRAGKKKEKALREIKSSYLDLMIVDPHLPKELLPSDWPAEEVRELIFDLSP